MFFNEGKGKIAGGGKARGEKEGKNTGMLRRGTGMGISKESRGEKVGNLCLGSVYLNIARKKDVVHAENQTT